MTDNFKAALAHIEEAIEEINDGLKILSKQVPIDQARISLWTGRLAKLKELRQQVAATP
jgi:hypothetical protein